MGARLYNPATGRFLTLDPVPGGNANPYTYPADPVNGEDLTGEYGKWEIAACAVIGPACYSARTITDYVRERVTLDNNTGNAQRHFILGFMLMAQIGRWRAVVVLESHEKGGSGGDWERDNQNNVLVLQSQWGNASRVAPWDRWRLRKLYAIADRNFKQAWNGSQSIRSFYCTNRARTWSRRCRPGDRRR